MKLLEIKNNLVKISYETDEQIKLASFIALVDNNRSYVAQIVNLKADVKSNFAVAKLIFTFNNEGVVDNYDGSAPSIQAELSFLNSKDILALLPTERPVFIGELAQQSEMLQVDQTIYEKNLVICAEKFDNIGTIVKNSVSQLEQVNEKCVVIDADHTFGEFEPIRFKRNFKLPLNARMIDFIYENELTEVDATSKAVIQDIFYEVQEYTKTVKGNYIPFDTFLNVVSEQYKATLMPELALLKNKLLKYQEANVFAQTQEDIDGLKNAIEQHAVTYIDIAEASDELQRELISHIHNVMDTLDGYTYLFVKLTNKTGNKKLLKQLLANEHVFTNIICSHAYMYLPELKQRAENIILFAPQTVQHDFASYNTFLSKLNANEFIIYGALTQNVPFIVELTDLEDSSSITSTYNQQQVIATENVVNMELTPDEVQTIEDSNIFNTQPEEEIIYAQETVIENPFVENDVTYSIPDQQEQLAHDELVEQVARDVDEVFYTNIAEEIPTIDEFAPQEEVLTEDDLDFIDDLPQTEYSDNSFDQIIEQPEYIEEQVPFIGTENYVEEQPTIVEDELFTNEEPVFEQELINDEPTINEFSEGITEEPAFEIEQAENFETDENFIEEDDTILVDEEPELPVYSAEEPVLGEESIGFEQGDMVAHPKYGRGVIEKLIKYGNKTLCSISFENVGRRLLDPAISELEKV